MTAAEREVVRELVAALREGWDVSFDGDCCDESCEDCRPHAALIARAEALLAESCVCTEGDPCDYHAATCTTCTPRCTGHPAEPVASATEPAGETACPRGDAFCRTEFGREIAAAHAERDAALAERDHLAAELRQREGDFDRMTALREERDAALAEVAETRAGWLASYRVRERKEDILANSVERLRAERDAALARAEQAERSDAESIAMYHRARDRAEQMERELTEIRDALGAVDREPTHDAARRVQHEAEHARHHAGKYGAGYNAGRNAADAGTRGWLEYVGRIQAERDRLAAEVERLRDDVAVAHLTTYGNASDALDEAGVAQVNSEGQIMGLESRVRTLAAELATMTQAVGLATTIKGDMIVRADQPIKMMREVAAYVDGLRAELATAYAQIDSLQLDFTNQGLELATARRERTRIADQLYRLCDRYADESRIPVGQVCGLADELADKGDA